MKIRENTKKKNMGSRKRELKHKKRARGIPRVVVTGDPRRKTGQLRGEGFCQMEQESQHQEENGVLDGFAVVILLLAY